MVMEEMKELQTTKFTSFGSGKRHAQQNPTTNLEQENPKPDIMSCSTAVAASSSTSSVRYLTLEVELDSVI